jgi:membrane protein YqaA with SNARE-associated domain
MTSLRHRTLAIARSRHAERGLFLVSFAESSFFPIPPDIILGPLAASRRERWLHFAVLCTVASVLGGLAGYGIGLFLYHSVGKFIIDLFGYAGQEVELRAFYDTWGVWAVVIGGFTPVPYKLVTILSGAMHYNLPIFILGSVVSRGLRFVIVAWLFKTYGPKVATMIEERMGLALLLLVLLLVAVFVLVQYGH